MALQDKMDQLMTYMGDLGVMEAELRKYERDIIPDIGDSKFGREGIHSMAQAMPTTINKSGSFFREQTEAIKKISPSVAEQLDSILAAYEDVQVIIEGEFQKESDEKDKKYMSPELIESLDTHILELGKHHDKMRKAMTLAYNCITGAGNFMTFDGARKAGRRAGRGG